MIISASRRTDIPAFYSKWFIKRTRAGFCEVRNPFNPLQVSRVSLLPENVDAIVFWTRNPGPLFPHLKELDASGHKYYFLFTLLDYPVVFEPERQKTEKSIEVFKKLSDFIGPEKVIWRYDPIIFSSLTDVDFHLEKFHQLAENLNGYTKKVKISIIQVYNKVKKNLVALEKQNLSVIAPTEENLTILIPKMIKIANSNGMEIISCADETGLDKFGIQPGKCIDEQYINQTFRLNLSGKKDSNQRKACGCIVSKDIGSYDTCQNGCIYCYATRNIETAQKNFYKHDPDSKSL